MGSQSAIDAAVALTIGKTEAGMAVVLTDDFQLLEMPASLLPDVRAGSVVRMRIEHAIDLESHREAEFRALQARILDEFGAAPDADVIAQCLAIDCKTHTSLTLTWPSWRALCPAGRPPTLHAVDCLCNGRRMATCNTISDSETTLRLTGLEPGQTYSIRLVFRTSAGRFSTNQVTTMTPNLEDLSCLKVLVDGEVAEETVETLRELGMQVLSNFCPDRTTHVVTTRSAAELKGGTDNGELLRLCTRSNIPIVTAEWLKACKASGRMQSVSHFYTQ